MKIKKAKMKKTIIIGILLMLVFAVQVNAAGVSIKIDDMSVEQGSKSMIPVSVAGASKLGAMDIKMEYDPAVLKFVDAELGEISTNGIIESNEVSPGTVPLSFADTKGISGDGTLIELNFEVTGAVGSSTKIEIKARAYGIDLKDISAETNGGTITVSEKVFPVHFLFFGVAGVAGLAFLIFLFLLVTRRKPAPVATPVTPPARPARPRARPEELVSRRPPARPEGPPERLGGGKPSGPPETLDQLPNEVP